MTWTSSEPRINVTERDIALMRGLFEARVMTLQHAAVFHFGGSIEAATKRIQKLKAAGLIGERPRRPYEPSILYLLSEAFGVLAERGALADYPQIARSSLIKRAHVSELTLHHELDVLDVRAAFWKRLACEPTYEIAEFTTWPLLSQFYAASSPGAPATLVRPDGFIHIIERKPNGIRFQHRFFLEIDRSTETQRILAAKAACYSDYYRRGGFATRNGRPRCEFRDFPFRVLISCRNAERRNNAAERMLQSRPPVLTQVWLTTFDELIADPLGPIWMRPWDYHDATRGTIHTHCENNTHIGAYRRRTHRDAHVERSVKKNRLWNPERALATNRDSTVTTHASAAVLLKK